MKRLVILALVVVLSACPVACVNDPTTDNSLGWQTDTSTFCDVTSTETSTCVDTAN